MEDENVVTSTPVEGDVVQVTQPSEGMTPAPEPSTPMMEPSTETTPQTTGAPDYERTQAVQTEQTLAENYINDARTDSYIYKGHGISDWIKNEYNYDQREAGTMWVAGKINDVATQMSFLEATLNEDMYGELDLQKYFFDTNLATARAYANEKKHETAYGYYRAAQEKALAEGDLIGWYMPAEANYMLSQWAIANENLKNPNLNTMDHYRAGSVKEAVEGWFNANNITWRGIECLNSLYLKETIRHNKENERLQEQANQIAAAQNAANRAAAASNYNLQLRQFEFQNAQMELQWGLDLNNNGVIGHTNWDPVDGSWTGDANNFGWYPTQKLWAQHNLDAAFKLWGTEEMKTILGNDYWDSKHFYDGAVEQERMQEIYNVNDGQTLVTKDNLNKFGDYKLKTNETIKVLNIFNGEEIDFKIDPSNNQLYKYTDKDGTVRLYVFDKDGVAYQLQNSYYFTQSKDKKYEFNDILLADKTKLQDALTESRTTLSKNIDAPVVKDKNGNDVQMQIGVQSKKYYQKSFTSESGLYTKISDDTEDSSKDLENQGQIWQHGVISTAGINANMVFKDPETGKLQEVEWNGDIHDTKNGQTVAVTLNVDKDGKITVTQTHADGGKIKNGWMQANFNDYTQLAMKQVQTVGRDKDGNEIYQYINPDNSVIWFSSEYDPTKLDGEHLDYVYKVYGDGGAMWENKIHVMTDKELIKAKVFDSVDEINKVRDGVYNYSNNLKESIQSVPEDYKTVKSTDEYINDTNKNMSDKAKKNAENTVSQHYGTSSTGSNATVRTVTNTNDTAKTTTKKVSKETKEDQVITDSSKETETGNIGEQAKEEIEENQKRYTQLFSIG